MTLQINEYHISHIDRKDAVSFLGCRDENLLDANTKALFCKYEAELLKIASPRSVFKAFPSDSGELKKSIIGCDIKEHLTGSEYTVLMCTTLGADTDKLFRQTTISDLAGTVVLEALSGALTEQVCGLCEEKIKEIYPEYMLTGRYSPGYGDYPIEVQSVFLEALDAGRKIGLYASASHLLTPRKSVTAVIGLIYKGI